MADREKQRPGASERDKAPEDETREDKTPDEESKGQYGGLTHGLGYGGGRDIGDLMKPDEEEPKPEERDK